jgi:hypothetical protein
VKLTIWIVEIAICVIKNTAKSTRASTFCNKQCTSSEDPDETKRNKGCLNPLDDLAFQNVIVSGNGQKGPDRCQDCSAVAGAQDGVKQVHDLKTFLFVGGI